MSLRFPIETRDLLEGVARALGGILLATAMLQPGAARAAGEERIEKDGVVLYWGLVPEAIVSQQHAIDDLHGGRPPGGGKINHLVLALFDARTGARIDDAIVRAQLSETGIAQEPAKYVPPMPVNGVGSYGQLFGMVHDGPYRFKVFVKLHERTHEIEYDFTAGQQLAR